MLGGDMWDLGGRGTEGLPEMHENPRHTERPRPRTEPHTGIGEIRVGEGAKRQLTGVFLCDPYTCGPYLFSLGHSLVSRPPVEFPRSLSTGKAPCRNVSLRPLPTASPQGWMLTL